MLGAGLARSVLRDHSCRLRGGRERSGYLRSGFRCCRTVSWLKIGMLGSSRPHPHPLVTVFSPLGAHFPSHLPSESPKAGGIELSPRTTEVLAWCCPDQRLPLPIRGRGLVGPSCVWHLHTWGHPRAQEAGILGAGMVVVASDCSHQGTYQMLRPLSGRAMAGGGPWGP